MLGLKWLLESLKNLKSQIDDSTHEEKDYSDSYADWKLYQKKLSLPESTSKTDTLEQSLCLIRATLESTADGILMINRDGRMVDFNQKFPEMWQIPDEIMASGDEEKAFQHVLSQVKDPEKLFQEVTKLYDNPEEKGNLGEIQFLDGRVFERYSQPTRIKNEIVGRVWSFRDITNRRRIEEALRLRDRAIEASTHGVIIININQSGFPIVYVNQSFEKLTGYNKLEVMNQSIKVLFGKKLEQSAVRKVRKAILGHYEEQLEMLFYHKAGKEFWNELHIAPVPDQNGIVNHCVIIFNDITQRRIMEQQLIEQATHDTLTKLPNRTLLTDRVQQSILMARRINKSVGFIFLDIDQFKLINDSLGHSIGDKLLQKVAKRLTKCMRESDTVSRIGGDEFVILLNELEKEEDSITRCQQILSSFVEPFKIDTHHLTITVSMGLSFYPKDGKDFETLMQNADLSMYHAKDAGRNTFRMYSSDMNTKVNRRLELENKLRIALDSNQFHLAYQPIVNLNEQTISGFEALIRWKNDNKLISPIEFIPIAEEIGLINQISQWVLKTAITQTQLWHKQGHKHLKVAVNLSAREFKLDQIDRYIFNLLQETQFPPECLELELTESILIENVHETILILNRLKEMGVSVAIDDFGTGYSSLNYLKQFKVDKLKIDRSFVSDVNPGSDQSSVTKAIIELAHNLGFSVIAEGIENDYQYQFLSFNHCDYGQGYFLERPQEAEYWNEFLTQHPNRQLPHILEYGEAVSQENLSHSNGYTSQ